MLGLKEICGLTVIFGCFMALTTPVPLDKGKKTCLIELKRVAEELFKTYKEGTGVNETELIVMRQRFTTALPKGLPNCSRNTDTYLDFVVAFNSLFIDMYNRSDKWLKDPVKTRLEAVIGQQSACLSNNIMSETNNLNIVFNAPPAHKEFDMKGIYYHTFESFKICMDQLSGTTV